MGALVAGCGGAAGRATDAATSVDSGGGDPAAHASLPPVDYLGGPIVATPKIVTVTYGADSDLGADPKRALAEAFDDTITTTPWWDAVRAGYCDQQTPPRCVGRGTSGGHVHLTDSAAAAYDDDPSGGSVRTLLQTYITSGTFPAPDADTIYVVFFPETSTITADGWAVSCRDFLAYHASFQATLAGGGTATVPYVVVPRCSSGDDNLTQAVSHELIEAATDPHDPDPAIGGDGYSMTTDTVWPVFGEGGEVADLCMWTNDSFLSREGPYGVVRTWSNLAAAAGHDPCVPAPDPATHPYFNVAPSRDQVSVGVGQSMTLDLNAFSDGPAPDWAVTVLDVSSTFGGTPGAAAVTLDRSSANDGTTLHLTIKMTHAAPAGKPVYLLLSSTNGTVVHRWPLAITTP